MSLSSVRARRWRVAASAAVTVVLALVSVPAFADNIHDDVAASGPTTITLVGGTASTTIQYYVQAAGGCDISSTPSVWNVDITGPAGVTPSSATISFSACGVNTPLTYTATSAGVRTIKLSYNSGPTLGGSNVSNPADVVLTVNGPVADDDSDDDGVDDDVDNCPSTPNSDQANADGDALGDACDSNSYAPQVSTDATDTSGVEGSLQTNSGAFSDGDGNSTLTISGSGAGTVVDNGDGTWSWSHTPLDNSGGTVTVTASDGEHPDAVDTFNWVATNADPLVGQPSFDPGMLDCNNVATLDGVSFSDAGVLDADWTITIDWGDGSTDTVLTADTQGPQAPDPTHLYTTPGSYTATVTVVDKDGGSGNNTSTNSITINQTYAVDFLPPFDDSSPSGLIVNKMKNGRVVPVKTTIKDECTGAFVTDPAEVVTIKTSKTSGTGTGDPVEEYADAGQSASSTNRFRWSSDGFWIYNLDSKALGLVVNNNYRVDVYVDSVKATQDTWAVLQPVK